MTMDALGVDFGDHSLFYAADQWNERGYFERRDVIDMNSRLLTGFARTTSSLSSALSQLSYLLVASDRTIDRRASQLRPAMDQLSGELHGLAVKDPRFSLTLSVWGDAIEDCVVCLRPPAEVALSLKRRQRIPTAIGFRFWDRHAAGVLEHAPDHSLYLDFTELSGPDPLPELMRIDEHFGLGFSPDELRARFEARFSRRLTHFSGESLAMPDATERLWNELQRRRQSSSNT